MTKRKQPQLSKLAHPMQPIGFDESGTVRFKKNAIVRALLDEGAIGMNQIVIRMNQKGGFSKEDYTQFIQLIGYSVSGAGELSAFDRKLIAQADAEASKVRKATEKA